MDVTEENVSERDADDPLWVFIKGASKIISIRLNNR